MLSGPGMASLICDEFARVVTARRRHVAIAGRSERLTRTFDDLWRDYEAMSGALAGAALPPAPCIVSSVGNRVAFVPLLLACLDAGAAFVLLDGGATDAEIDATAAQFGAHAVIRKPSAGGHVPPSMTALPGGVLLDRKPVSAPPSWRTGAGGEPLIIKLTSGSTHRPKGVIATEAQIAADGWHIIEAMGITPHDVNYAAVPISHAYGMGNLLLPLLLQGTSMVLRESFVPAQLEEDIAAGGVTVMPGVPYMYDYLRRHGELAGALAPLRLLVTAGAPIDAATLQFFKSTWRQKIHSLYGTSETGGITFDDTDELHDPLTVGRALPGTTISLMPSPAAGPGEGRLHVKGDAVAARYAMGEDDVEPLSAFTPDGFLTGDLARIQPDGYVVLTGRVSRFVNVAGRKVQPEEVERVIAAIPGVLQASVIGAPHPSRGQMLVACVRRRDRGLSAAEIRAACATKLSAYKIPRRVVFTDDLPVDARGKIDRRALEALVHRTLAEEGSPDAV